MFQTALLKKMLKDQGIPDDQIEMFVKMMEKDPELFKKIAEEIQEEVKGGKDPNTAGMDVMKKYEEQLKVLL